MRTRRARQSERVAIRGVARRPAAKEGKSWVRVPSRPDGGHAFALYNKMRTKLPKQKCMLVR